MDIIRAARLKQYVDMISKSHGGIDGLLSGPLFAGHTAAGWSPLEGFEAPVEERLLSAKAALEAIETGVTLSPDALAYTEAIIAEDIRPAIKVVDGKFVSMHPLWTHLSTDETIRTRIETALPSIGRIELPGHKRLPYGGTGFVVGDGIIMTNRHVAELFARGLGDHRLDFISGAKAGIDFGREFGRPTASILAVKRVLMIHPYWDMALLSVEGLDPRVTPLKLASRDARDLAGTQIAVVGYPGYDSRNPADIQKSLFEGHFGVKRLQPGELQGAVQAASFGKFVNAAAHDCSTLGGNSGSALLDLASGEVLGLHFGGVFHDVNYSVPAYALASDSRVLDAGVLIAGPRPASSIDWIDRWKAADLGTGAQTEPTSAPASRLAPGGAPEAMVEPLHDTDYSSRTGFAEDFLGTETGHRVPFPSAVNPALLAPRLDGQGHLLHYQNFSIAMHAERRLAMFTASNITREAALRNPEPGLPTTRRALTGLRENDIEKWFLDTRMDARYQLPDVFFTKDRQAFDKGHLVRREDVVWGTSYALLQRANGDSFHVTNCSPQVAGFNRSGNGTDNWGDLENNVLSSAASERLTVLAGPVFSDQDRGFAGAGLHGASIEAMIPSRYWKVVVARVPAGLAAYAFVLEQDLSKVKFEELIVPENFLPMMIPITALEAETGLDFGQVLRDGDQYGSEAAFELVLRGVANMPLAT
jgi:endonuclease G